MGDVLIKDPLTMNDSQMGDIELDMPDYAISEELSIGELGEFCVALAGSVGKGFSLEEGVRVGRRAVDMRIGGHSLLHFHLWENAEDVHELQVRLGKIARDQVKIHFMAEGWATGKVVAALNTAKGIEAD
jgi:hypothetical protein